MVKPKAGHFPIVEPHPTAEALTVVHHYSLKQNQCSNYKHIRFLVGSFCFEKRLSVLESRKLKKKKKNSNLKALVLLTNWP